MHVGLNLVFLTPEETGGLETYARQLIPELVAAAPSDRFTAFVNRDAARAGGPWNADGVAMVTVPVSARNRFEWVRGEQQLLPGLARRAGIEVLHSLANTAPLWGGPPRVVTVHDLIYHHLPEASGSLRARAMRVLVPLAARRAARIIAISHATAADVMTLRGVDPAAVDVIPNGPGSAPHATALPETEIRSRLDAGDRPIVLSVSARLPHKNLRRLISAVAGLAPERRPLLVLPGYTTGYEAKLRSHTDALGVGADVRFLSWVAPEELEGLYGAASCFVFPSLIEGFGAPVLEAMVRGVPVACSGSGALAEVAGSAALLFDPESEAEIAAAIVRLLEDRPLAEQLVLAGRERAAQFSWRATAEGTLASYRRTLAGGQRPRPPAAPA